jgi:hypothetical protein
VLRPNGAIKDVLSWYEGARRTLICLAITWHLVAEAIAFGIVDRLIEFALFARRHDLTPLRLVGETC